jgi:hypothetical protein
MKIGDDAVEEGPPGIELDRAHHPLSESAKVAVQVKEQIHAGGEQEETTCSALEGDQAENAPASGRVRGFGHRATAIAGASPTRLLRPVEELNMPRASFGSARSELHRRRPRQVGNDR